MHLNGEQDIRSSLLLNAELPLLFTEGAFEELRGCECFPAGR